MKHLIKETTEKLQKGLISKEDADKILTALYDTKYADVNILELKDSVEKTLNLFHPAIWSLEKGSKEQEKFIEANNNLNEFYHKLLKKY